ncbi:TonB-dependent receptor [Bacteroides sp. 51]|uniref:SusC/RagA family TonB-linked outer membrane protein n=1 Tax=Bacteroides sp. 51 TaxID=2302938 RepID=UPI0013D2897C|nr:TonB-dependent receptor [Bacteroides sp. 51]NDV81719.1 TonB-dependent receptor [Bacteroides sp. 51]
MRNKIIILMLCFIALPVISHAQGVGRDISGTVKDEEGLPLSGTTVHIKNASIGAITDMDGNFSIKASNKDILIFTFMGYQTQEIPVGNKNNFVVDMVPDNQMLSEVVVVGYGQQKKVNLTGAVASVDLNDVDGRALVSAEQALQGKVPGINIVQNSGRPGDDGASIRIRGVSSIDNNNDPLVIIDGVEGNIGDVSPGDIASVSVLKDAASASIYGSRASAGVIIIETKKGTTGKGLQIEYNATGSITQATRLPKTVDSYTYATLLNEARANVALPPTYNEEQLEYFKNQTSLAYPSTNWYDQYFKDGYMQNHNLSLRGGEQRYRYSASVTYRDQEGILIGTSADRLSFNTNLSGNAYKNRLRFSLGVSGYNEKNKELTSPTNSVMAEIAGYLPTIFIRGTDPLTGEEDLYSYNARFIAAKELGGGTNRKMTNLNLKGSIEVEPIKNLVGKVMLSNNVYKTDYVNFSPEFYTAGSYEQATISKRESLLEKKFVNSEYNTLFTSLSYSIDWNKHKASVLLAHERLETIYKYDQGNVKDLSTNAPIFNFGDPNTASLLSNAWETATLSYFGRLNYSYADKYLLEVNMRRDGSSRFSEDNRWGNFPSVSAGWRITQEPFMKNIKKFMELKVRGSWGKLGNQNIESKYAFADVMSGSEYYAFGNKVVPGRGTTTLANRNTRWETSQQLDFGFDAVLWNRLNITVDYFRKETNDILARVTIPPSLGATTQPYQNVGDMVNKGVELSVSYKSKYKPDGFNYEVGFNCSYITNELTNLGPLDFIDHSSSMRSAVGQPFSSYYGYKVEGIYQVSDFTWQNNSDASIAHADRQYKLKEGLPDPSGIMTNPAPGDIKIKNVNDTDDVINSDDKTFIGNPMPKFQYAINVNLSYKNFGLGIIGQGVGHTDAYMNGNLIAPFYNTNGPIRKNMVEDRWTFDNPSTKYHRIYSDKGRDALVTSYNIYNAAYFRLKSVQLSYTVDKKLTEKVGINRCRVFLTGENLLLLTNFVEGFDPERKYNAVSAAFHPQVATYSVGVNINF